MCHGIIVNLVCCSDTAYFLSTNNTDSTVIFTVNHLIHHLMILQLMISISGGLCLSQAKIKNQLFIINLYIYSLAELDWTDSQSDGVLANFSNL